jgi:hypothetical protein
MPDGMVEEKEKLISDLLQIRRNQLERVNAQLAREPHSDLSACIRFDYDNRGAPYTLNESGFVEMDETAVIEEIMNTIQ